MSRLWRNCMQVFLAPGRVNLVGFARGIKPMQRFRQSGTCGQANAASQWQAPLQVLEQMIGQVDDSFRRGAELHITLSNYFVRYGVIAPQSSPANPDELMAYAGFQMREIYGEHVDNWELSLGIWDPHGGTLCAAIARDLQSELEALAQRHEMLLVHIEPYLAAALDHWSKQLNDKQIWFVLVESGRFCLVSLLDGVWCGVRNQKVVENLQEELLSALVQESIMSSSGQLRERVYVFAPELARPLPDVYDSRWQFVHWPDESYPVPAHFPWIKKVDDRQNHA
ncbi:hypothetical protein [Nitrosomonas eutropha]|uniref:Uncharacterized protein n=2 Tax=Nitrosomonas eutropha TaxID=916 RepID=A0ABX5M734_9PROT|nr:hypothetical protein [Nitrosomonas eutropha]ABI58785.1 conserved hypothetical protein [Nitrosomonas eutropha C91]PXV81171.1 hypothetical protein C8R14_11247 [Nitrosomonas eutropha]SEI75260.1 hypothetical protein SAMN05216318_11024 [Nitrosomonas eutropha]